MLHAQLKKRNQLFFEGKSCFILFIFDSSMFDFPRIRSKNSSSEDLIDS